MKIEIDLRDRHGDSIEIFQPVALRVQRRGGHGNWWQQVNREHFTYFWIPGRFEIFRNPYDLVHIRFVPDRQSEDSLARPMGREREKQVVDHISVDLYNPMNLDARDIPRPGEWRRDTERTEGKAE